MGGDEADLLNGSQLLPVPALPLTALRSRNDVAPVGDAAASSGCCRLAPLPPPFLADSVRSPIDDREDGAAVETSLGGWRFEADEADDCAARLRCSFSWRCCCLSSIGRNRFRVVPVLLLPPLGLGSRAAAAALWAAGGDVVGCVASAVLPSRSSFCEGGAALLPKPMAVDVAVWWQAYPVKCCTRRREAAYLVAPYHCCTHEPTDDWRPRWSVVTVHQSLHPADLLG